MSHSRLILRWLPFLNWLPELRKPQILRADLLAGITVALVLIPQSMAYAQLAGLPAYYGLYAAFLPPMVAALFGSSRQLATGPVAVVSLLSAAALEPLATAGSNEYVAYAIVLALLVGIFQLLLGVLRLGVLVNFLSHPVVLGFTNAAALIIATSQLGKIFGVEVGKAPQHYLTVWRTIEAAWHDLHWPTLAFALGAFAIMLLVRRINPRLPNVLIAVVVTTLLAWWLAFDQRRTVDIETVAVPSVQQILRQHHALLAELNVLEERIRSGKQALEAALRKYGYDDERTLQQRYSLDLLILQRERLVKTRQTSWSELKALHFESGQDRQGQMRFFLRGHVPDGWIADGRRWRLRAIRPDGRLEFHAGGQVVGDIPAGLPSLQWPQLDFAGVLQLLASVVAIALIGFMEAISIARAMATHTRQRLDTNQELVGQGLANLTGSLFQSYAVSGSFSRSAVNFDSGAVTGFSSVVTSLVVAVTLLWLTPWLYHLPHATLAAVIMLAVLGLVNVRAMGHAWRVHRQDGIIAFTTFGLTLLFAPHLEIAILIGIGLSLVLYLLHTMRPRVVVLGRHPDGSFRDAERLGLKTCDELTLLRFDGSLYFADTSYFEDKVLEKLAIKPKLRFIIVVASGINYLDFTGEEMLKGLTERLESRGIELLFAGTKKQIQDVLAVSGYIEQYGAARFFPTTEAALHYVARQLEPAARAACPLLQDV